MAEKKVIIFVKSHQHYEGTEPEDLELISEGLMDTAEDGTVTLSLYQLTEAGAGYTITDYADVALDNYEDSGVTQDYDLSTVATIQSAADGALTDALLGDIAVGDVLILYTTADGGAGVVIYPAAS